ncbi:MAG TPA: hypothetical protein VJZ03_05875 [Candidatus Bathyarchaeia archaeon]|nr:hypothetical protein [Candidatus Bathyarchaeia archaeon]
MRLFLFLNNVAPIKPPAATTTPPITNSRLVRGISTPKIERLVGDEFVVTADAVDEAGLEDDVDVIEEVGGDDVVVAKVDVGELTGEVDVREMIVDVIEIETLPVVPIIITEEGKLNSTVAYPLVNCVGPLTNTNTK